MAYTDEFGNIYEDDALSGDSGSSFDNFDYSYGSSGYGFADANDPYEITNTATNPGEIGYNWKYYSDGTSISQSLLESKIAFQLSKLINIKSC